MDTRPISAVMAIAAYQLPVARSYSQQEGVVYPAPLPREDSVQISAEARARAARDAVDLHLWGEVRYDPPHTDDPDLPWEVEHEQWTSLMEKVFGKSADTAETA